MNLFVLDNDPIIAAKMNCDSHVCKIILESLQMMSLVHIECGSNEKWLWNAHTHKNNPISIWVRESLKNYQWTFNHALTLCSEYTNRYNKIHKCEEMIKWCSENIPPFKSIEMTPFRQGVKSDCYHEDTVIAYRMYYVKYKRSFAKWKLGNTPQWFVDMCALEDFKNATS